MNDVPLISVLMPAYNCKNFIKQAIDSILDQSYQNLELLIADDASGDGTKKIIDSYSDIRIKTFHNEQNIGYLKTFNKLIALAEGDYITFQDADDYSHPNRIELLVKEFKEDKDLGACGSNYTRVDKKGNKIFDSNFSLTHAEIIKKMPEQFDFTGSGLMIKKEVYLEIGGYNEFFDRMGGEDFYWFYLIAEKYKIKNIKSSLYFYRANPNSVAGDISDNRKKIYGVNILNYLIIQRRDNGHDDLNDGNFDSLDHMIKSLDEPYVLDKSLFYRKLSVKYFYEGLTRRALVLGFNAICKNFRNFENIKNLFYFLKIILKRKFNFKN